MKEESKGWSASLEKRMTERGERNEGWGMELGLESGDFFVCRTPHVGRGARYTFRGCRFGEGESQALRD